LPNPTARDVYTLFFFPEGFDVIKRPNILSSIPDNSLTASCGEEIRLVGTRQMSACLKKYMSQDARGFVLPNQMVTILLPAKNRHYPNIFQSLRQPC
jgi:hypothetical protein